MSQTRLHYHAIPDVDLKYAKTIALDANIASRIESIYRSAAAGRQVNVEPHDVARLSWLLDHLPDRFALITGLAASEAQIRPEARDPDLQSYTHRHETSYFLVGEGRSLLRRILAGETLDSSEFRATDQIAVADTVFEQFRQWILPAYAALLRAVELHYQNLGAAEAVEQYRWWLAYELKGLPGKEAWLGFLLLGGRPSEKSKVARLLKLDLGSANFDPDKLFRHVWGGAWDLMYLRLVSGPSPEYMRHANLHPPMVFVTDDDALADVMQSVSTAGLVRGGTGAEFTGDLMDASLLLDVARPTVIRFLERETPRILKRSRGATGPSLAIADRQKRLTETRLRRQAEEG